MWAALAHVQTPVVVAPHEHESWKHGEAALTLAVPEASIAPVQAAEQAETTDRPLILTVVSVVFIALPLVWALAVGRSATGALALGVPALVVGVLWLSGADWGRLLWLWGAPVLLVASFFVRVPLLSDSVPSAPFGLVAYIVTAFVLTRPNVVEYFKS